MRPCSISSATVRASRCPTLPTKRRVGAKMRAELGRRLSRARIRRRGNNPCTRILAIATWIRPLWCRTDHCRPEPEDSRDYMQTSHPGCRAPHAWLEDGRSTLDLFGRGFTLCCGFPVPSADAVVAAARNRGVPLDVVDLEDSEVAALCDRKLVLVRPDGHVAWRGDAAPSDAGIVDGSGPRRTAGAACCPKRAVRDGWRLGKIGLR